MGKTVKLTTIAIYLSTKKALDELKDYPEQSYAKLIAKLTAEKGGS